MSRGTQRLCQRREGRATRRARGAGADIRPGCPPMNHPCPVIVMPHDHLSSRGSTMRIVPGCVLALTLSLLVVPLIRAEGQDGSRSVAGGGISVPGWSGKIDASEE